MISAEPSLAHPGPLASIDPPCLDNIPSFKYFVPSGHEAVASIVSISTALAVRISGAAKKLTVSAIRGMSRVIFILLIHV